MKMFDKASFFCKKKVFQVDIKNQTWSLQYQSESQDETPFVKVVWADQHCALKSFQAFWLSSVCWNIRNVTH